MDIPSQHLCRYAFMQIWNFNKGNKKKVKKKIPYDLYCDVEHIKIEGIIFELFPLSDANENNKHY